MVLGNARLGDIFQGRIDLIARLEIKILGLIGFGRQGDALDVPRPSFHLQLLQQSHAQAPAPVFFLDNQSLDMGRFQSLLGLQDSCPLPIHLFNQVKTFWLNSQKIF